MDFNEGIGVAGTRVGISSSRGGRFRFLKKAYEEILRLVVYCLECRECIRSSKALLRSEAWGP